MNHFTLPMTDIQQGIWLSQQQLQDGSVYGVAEKMDIVGDFDGHLWLSAVTSVLARTPALHQRLDRTSAGQPGEIPLLVCDIESVPEPDFIDLEGYPNPEEELQERLEQACQEPLDLNVSVISHAQLYRLDAQRHCWFFRAHHLAIDGYGFSLLARNISKAYVQGTQDPNSLLQHTHTPDDIAHLYRHFESTVAALDSSRLGKEQHHEAHHYWKTQAPTHELVPIAPAVSHLMQVRQTVGEYRVPLDPAQLALCTAVVAATLHHKNEVVIGAHFLARPPELLTSVCTAQNELPIRLELEPNQTLNEALQQADAEWKNASRYQFYRHENIRRDRSLNPDEPLSEVGLNIVPFGRKQNLGSAVGTSSPLWTGPVEHLTLDVRATSPGRHTITLLAPEGSLDALTLATYGQLIHTVYSFITAPETSSSTQLSQIPLRLDTPDTPENTEDRGAPSSPHPELLSTGGFLNGLNTSEPLLTDDHGTLSGQELRDSICQLARYLLSQGITTQTRALTYLPRTRDGIIAPLAVLLAGGTFIPADTQWPTERLRLIIDHSKAEYILTTSAYAETLKAALPHDTAPHRARILCIDDPTCTRKLRELKSDPLHETELARPILPTDCAYILFTSGTTGTPKGVMVKHSNLSNYMKSVRSEYLPLIQASAAGSHPLRWIHEYSFAFDSMLSPLTLCLLGNHLFIPHEDTLKIPSAHREYITQNRITCIDTAPAVLSELLASGLTLEQFQVVFIGGDQCSQELWETLAQQEGLCALNVYGPTENTVDAAYAQVKDFATPHIGRALAGQHLCVVSPWGQQCPAGVPGELYISGPSVTGGYLDDPQRTAEKFFVHPLYGLTYRTGDLVVADEAGNLKYLGRGDDQLSLNGVRVERYEIEKALLNHPDIRQAVVTVHQDAQLGQRLIGYLVLTADGASEYSVRELREYLLERLPASYVPATFVVLDALPLTERGKVDYRQLPQPHREEAGGRKGSELSPSEQLVAKIYAEVLKLEESSVGSEDDLFMLGGHSLTATRALGRLYEAGIRNIQLADFFRDSRVSTIAHKAVKELPSHRPVVPRADCTPAQNRLWFLERMEGPSPLYTIPLVLEGEDNLDPALLLEALHDTALNYPSLGSLYRENTDGALELYRLTAEEMSQLLHLETVDYLDDVREQVAHLPLTIDIREQLPVRLFYSRHGQRYRIIIVLHHIAADGWSLAPLMESLSEAYRARTEHRIPAQKAVQAVPPARVTSPSDREFWVRTLEGSTSPLELPADRQRPAHRDHRGGEVTVKLGVENTRRLESLAREAHSTAFMVLHTLVATLLSRCGAGTDIVLGTIHSGRTTPADEDVIAFMANTLATRVHLDATRSFAQEVTHNRAHLVEALEHAHVPFDEVVNLLNPDRNPSYSPLIQVLVVYQNTESPILDTGHSRIPVATVGTGTSKFDMTFEFSTVAGVDGASDVELRLEYATDIFDAQTAESIAQWFKNLTQQCVSAPERPWVTHPLAPEAREQALASARAMVESCTRYMQRPPAPAAKIHDPQTWEYERSISTQLESIFNRYASAVAVIDDADKGSKTTYTYRQIDELSSHIAYVLTASGLPAGTRVALLLPRSIHQITAIAGVLRAGMTYVPIDPHYPAQRVDIILQDADISAIIHAGLEDLPEAQHLVDQRLAGQDIVTLDVRTVDGSLSSKFVPSPVSASTPAYIIFTSGSTGRPKGVVVPQRNVMRLLSSCQPRFNFSPADRWTLFHSYAFDFAVWEIFGALLLGGSLVIVPHSVTRSPQEFCELLEAEKVTVVNQTPSAFHQLVLADEELAVAQPTDRLASLRYIILGGEAMNPHMVNRWYRNRPGSGCHVINMYGITETTVHVTYQKVTADSAGQSPVGQPIEDLSVYLLDEQGNPVPPGITGEIYVGGAGVSLGYLGRDDLNRARFLPDPFAQEIQAGLPGMQGTAGTMTFRMYRSGDLAVQRRDGVLDFRGRNDRQIQLRGFRIELGEVEAAARKLPQVQDAFARTVGTSASDMRLVLYLVGPVTGQADPLELRRDIAAQLPPQMAPSAVIIVEKFPLTAHGKLDLAALPEPDFKPSEGRAPQTELEELIYECFKTTLKIDSCSAEDSFFDMGGHSMLAVELVARLKQVGIDIRVGTVMSSPTVALLAEAVARQQSEENQDDLAVMMPLQRSQGHERGAIYCVHPAGGLSWCYASMTKYIPRDVPVWGLQARGVLDPAHQPRSLKEMAESYIDEILQVHQGGPLHLVGWSLGGMVVQVMAAELEQRGLDVGFVALLDAYPSEGEQSVDEPPLEDAISAVLAMAGLEDEVLEGTFTREQLVKTLRGISSPMAGLPETVIEALLDTYRNTAKILREFNHEPTGRDVVIFRATRAGVGKDHSPDEWLPYVRGKLTVVDVDCTHREMTQGGPMSLIAPHLVQMLGHGQ